MGYILDKAEITTGVVMNRKQTVLFIIFLLIALAAVTLPLWIDRVLPHLDSYLWAAMDAAVRWIAVWMGFAGK
jgi:hypothetical protein